MVKFYYLNFFFRTFLIFLVFSIVSFSAQSQYWMQKAGGATIDESIDVAVDGSNNSYTVGYFTGLGIFGGTFLTSFGASDVFVTKINAQGNYVWARQAGGTGADRAEAVVADASGNVYVTGYFSGSVNFGSVSLVSAGTRDVFIAKYNTTGAIQWAVRAGGTDADLGFGIDVNNSGDVFVTGSFKDTASFGTFSLTANNATSDIFIVKLNSAGVFQWAKSGTSTLNNSGKSLGADNDGNVYITGQFSDTLTFDQTHNNQSQNIIFLVKFDSLGNEVWFTKLGGALTNAANDLAVDAVGNCYMTGDFSGSLNVYDINTGVASSITSTFPNTIFTAKYDSTGLWNLKGAVGSDNFISSNSIAVDNSGNYYIGGDFECDFTEFTNSYSAGNFLSVGEKDIYVAKFNANGTWNYSRNMGGSTNDVCNGIAVNNSGNVYAVGSFSDKFNVPVSSSFNTTNLSFWSANNCNSNVGYCNDADYGNYRTMSAQGNKDAFMLNAFDPNRSPYDYFKRSGTTCVKDINAICIENCIDTIQACGDTTIYVSSGLCNAIGPIVDYLWSTGDTINSTLVTTSGWVFATVSNKDGCISQVDSIYVEVNPAPSLPHISDSKGFNVDSILTTTVHLCAPDTSILTGGGFSPADTFWWEGPGLGGGVYDSTVIASAGGTYTFYVRNSIGCTVANMVGVFENYPLPPFNLAFTSGDSLEICRTDPFTVQLYDTVSNPTELEVCLANSVYTVESSWGISPDIQYTIFCETFGNFKADTSGYYTVYDTTVRFNYCYADTFTAQKTVYVTVNPKPVVRPFYLNLTGETTFCPGDSSILTASGGPNYSWFGAGVYGKTDSAVAVYSTGSYIVKSSKSDTNIYGCIGTFAVSNTINVTVKSQPTITANTIVICPGGTVDLTSSSPIGNSWEGPNGPIAGGQIISVSDPGQYFVVVNDADSCGLVSNTITIRQYTTPTLVPYGDTIICPGSTAVIGVQANPGSIINWYAPLLGSSLFQVVNAAGTYTCSIYSCGIFTNASITIHAGNPLAKINPVGILCKDSTMLLEGPPGMQSYAWLPNNETTQDINATSSGAYTLSIVDQTGCAGTSDTFRITEIVPNTGLVNSTLAFCYGDSTILQADTGLVNFSWSPGGQTTSSITVYQPGNYSLMVTDTNGCSLSSDPYVVTQSDSVAEISLSGDSIICERDTVWLNPVVTGYTSYIWMPGSISSVNLPVTQAGSYVLLATDSSGCRVESDSVRIEVWSSPVATVSPNGVLCKDSSLVLSGAAGMTSYQWSPGNQTTPYITVSNPGVYSLIITDTNGCESLTFPFSVSEITVPIEITNTVLGFCEGDTFVFTATSGMSEYLWLPSGDTNSSLVLTEAGSVTLMVVDTNGCRAETGPVSVTQSTVQTDIIGYSDTEICDGDFIVLTAGNSGFTSYEWMPGNQKLNSITVSTSGLYWFTATDSVGCISISDSVEVQVVDNNLVPPTVSYDSLVCEGSDVLFVADAGTNEVYWYDGVDTLFIHKGDSLIQQVFSNTVFFIQTVEAPCASVLGIVEVAIDDCEKPDVANVFTPNGDGVNDTWSLEITGVTCFEVKIYNRWGILIYTLEQNGQRWDGTIAKSEKEAPDGTYYYILNYCDYKEDTFSQTGYITLIR